MKPGQLSEGHWVKQICEFNFFSVKFFKIVQFFSHFCFLRLFANFWEPGVHSYHFYYVQSNFFVALFLSIKAKRPIALFWTNWFFFGTVQVATGILLLISTMIYVHCQTATHSLFLCKTCNSKCFLTLLIIFFASCSVFSNTDIYRTAKK